MKWTTLAAALAIVFSANFADAGLFGHHESIIRGAFQNRDISDETVFAVGLGQDRQIAQPREVRGEG